MWKIKTRNSNIVGMDQSVEVACCDSQVLMSQNKELDWEHMDNDESGDSLFWGIGLRTHG